MDSKKLAQTILYLILSILILNFLANKFYWYYSIWYFDIIMHFLGGFWVGLAVIYFFLPRAFSFNFISTTTILLSVLLVGVGWEVFEIVVNDVITQDHFDFVDSASDIFFDLSGGICAILYTLVPLKNERAGDKE